MSHEGLERTGPTDQIASVNDSCFSIVAKAAGQQKLISKTCIRIFTLTFIKLKISIIVTKENKYSLMVIERFTRDITCRTIALQIPSILLETGHFHN